VGSHVEVEWLRRDVTSAGNLPLFLMEYNLLRIHNDLMTAATFGAYEGSAVVGFSTLARGSAPARHAATLRLHVDHRRRGVGIGTRLLTAALEHADETTDIRRVVSTPYLPADASGFRKVAFFNRHGFTLEGIARKFARLEDGTFVDAALMARVR
jgi:L-phenylalanine/L-methionine N-acetyltransferase